MHNKEIRTILKNRRLELGYTMKKVAEYVGVSEATISRWESGNIANMRRDRIALLAEILQISPALIMGWTEESTSSPDTPMSDPAEDHLVNQYRKLNDDGQEKLIDYADDLVAAGRYRKRSADFQEGVDKEA